MRVKLSFLSRSLLLIRYGIYVIDHHFLFFLVGRLRVMLLIDKDFYS